MSTSLSSSSLSSISNCFRCGSVDIIDDYRVGDTICRGCGEVLNERLLVREKEWSNYSDGEWSSNNSQTRAERKTVQYGMSQTLFLGMSKEKRDHMMDLQLRCEDQKELKVIRMLESVDEIGGRLGLTPQIMERAKDLFGRVLMECTCCRHKVSRDKVAAAVISVVCRAEGFGRTFHEVSEASGIDKKVINSLQQSIAKELQLEIRPINPEDLVGRFGSKFGVSAYVIEHARSICQVIRKSSICIDSVPELIATNTIIVAYLISNYKATESASTAQASAHASITAAKRSIDTSDSLSDSSTSVSVQHTLQQMITRSSFSLALVLKAYHSLMDQRSCVRSASLKRDLDALPADLAQVLATATPTQATHTQKKSKSIHWSR